MSDKLYTKLVFPMLVCFLLMGCMTTNETDPTKVSWGDLLFGQDRLEDHLQERRNELAKLKKEADALGVRLSTKQQQLNQLDQKLNSVRQSNIRSKKELTQLQQDVKNKQIELQQTQEQIAALKQKEASLKAELETVKDKRTAAEKLTRYQIEIEQLETEVTLLEKAIDRILLVRVKKAIME